MVGLSALRVNRFLLLDAKVSGSAYECAFRRSKQQLDTREVRSARWETRWLSIFHLSLTSGNVVTYSCSITFERIERRTDGVVLANFTPVFSTVIPRTRKINWFFGRRFARRKLVKRVSFAARETHHTED